MNFFFHFFHENHIHRISVANDNLTHCKEKLTNLEKSKDRCMNEIDDLNLELDRANQKSVKFEKQVKHCDKIMLEWKMKAEGLKVELDDNRNCQK